MPDAARKWLEWYDELMAQYRDTPSKQYRGRTPSTYNAVAHLRRLLAEITQLREDLAPFIAQIDQRKTYEVRCDYCKRTPSEAEGGWKCSTCKQGGDDDA